MSESFGPQVTARPGTKRHANQLRLRAIFLAVQGVNARANARRAGEREAAALAEAEAHAQAAAQARDCATAHLEVAQAVQERINAVASLALLISEPQGNA